MASMTNQSGAHQSETTFPILTSYIGSSRGAQWNKWDLHVHTPFSFEQYYGESTQQETWDRYISALAALPSEIKAIGINDYYCIDGYRRVIEAHRQGKLPNLDLILPIIELRTSTFVGSVGARKLNLHVLFADTVPLEHIEGFFLRQLNDELELVGGSPWRGCLGTRQGLMDLGGAVKAATPASTRSTDSDLQVGFANAAVNRQVLFAALDQSVFAGQYLVGLGCSEFMQMRWEGAGAAHKRDAIGRVDFLLTCSPSLDQYRENRAKLTRDEVNSRLFDSSDAHYYADSSQPNRLGACRTWIKADLSFQGLRRALTRFDDRVFVGASPPKVEHVRQNATKYIDRITIRKRDGSSLKEAWFDADIPISHDLVAIIGNQGSGKSALTDIIAICGRTHNNSFSFLTSQKFRDKRKRAAEFAAAITWADKQVTSGSLERDTPPQELERVRYIPQGFFDGLTNETALSDGSQFYSEIKKVIFSHIPLDERLGLTCLDDLIDFHSQAADKELEQLRAELRELNRLVSTEEDACSSKALARVDADIQRVLAEIAALQANAPVEIVAPAESVHASQQIEALLHEASEIRSRIASAESQRGRAKRQRASVDQALQALRAEERRVNTAVDKVRDGLKSEELDIDLTAVLSVRTDYELLENLGRTIDGEILLVEGQLDNNIPDSLGQRLEQCEAARRSLQQQSDAAAAEYQAYLVRRSEWQTKIEALRGEGGTPTSESLVGLRGQRIELVDTKPAAIEDWREQRREKVKQIYSVLARQAEVYERIARPVRQHIQVHELTRDHYRLKFDVQITYLGLADRFFALVNQQSGSFAGVEQGKGVLQALATEADFSTHDGVVEFAENLVDHLTRKNRDSLLPKLDIAAGLKKNATVSDVYDLIYSLDYLKPTFELGLNDKPLLRLSPGERGILLLVFYLVVDLGDEPLIVDQPEGNLNNQSIVDHLVPVIMAAKGRRQIIIVTHNPNIAVVCDAEQIVHCEMAQDDSYRITYSAGALENPKFNRLSLDLLEGTGKALDARVTTYERTNSQVVSGPAH